MIQALQNALSGINSASQQFQAAAQSVSAPPETSKASTTIAANSGKTDLDPNTNSQKIPKSPLASDITAISEEQSLAEGLVAIKEAETAYKANAAVASALQDTQGRVLEILS